MALALRIVVMLFLSAALAAVLVASSPSPVTTTAPRVASYRPQSEPAVAWNGSLGLVVWHGAAGWGRHLYGSRVDAAGAPLDAKPFVISTDGNQARMQVVAL